MPVLKTRAALRKVAQGTRMWVHTDDPLAVIDIPAFCNEHGQELIEQEDLGESGHRFLIERRESKL